eukprot:12176564-Alexandrium_andersonii.AAC.1
MQRAPACNIHSEDRFARHSRHAKTSQGNPATPATVCSGHVLAEAKTVLDTDLWCRGGLNCHMRG